MKSIKRIFVSKFRRFKRVYRLEKQFKREKNKRIFLNTRSEIPFPEFENPLVSIIIPFFNQIDFTLNCLNHLYTHLKDETISYEIILIDDNSTEKCKLQENSTIRMIKNKVNLGFLKSCNVGIIEAKGQYIYFLNNDTEVQKGFLTELLWVFNNYENVGAVGSKLINYDGTLQEAGVVFTRGFNIHQIFHKRRVYFPEVNYIKKVDSCSGCSLLFKRNNAQGELNLLDEQFAPAYFEETDLCFQLKYLSNLDVYYTPFSEVVHFNGVSYHNNSLSKKRNKKNKSEVLIPSKKDLLFEKNNSLFYQKWSSFIEGINSESINERVIEKYNNQQIVFYVDVLPQFDKDSGSNRFLEIVKIFKKLDFHISIVADLNKIENSYNQFYQRLGVQVFYEYDKTKNFVHFLENHTISNVYHWFCGPDAFVKYYGQIIEKIKVGKIIFDMIDIHHLRFQRAAEIGENVKLNQKLFQKYLKIEKQCSEVSDIVIAISDVEKEYMEKMVKSSKVLTISNIHYPKVDRENLLSFSDRKDILFIGSRHAPNVDAVKWLYSEIMPKVWNVLPDVKVNVVGNVGNSIQDIRDKRMLFHGFVPEVTTFFLENKMTISPLRYGAGVKGKVGQSFEYYLPVVTTSIGAEGMKLENGVHALIADDADLFAKNIIDLYTNNVLWSSLQNNTQQSLSTFSVQSVQQVIKKEIMS